MDVATLCFVVFAMVGCVLAMPTFRYANIIGLITADLSLLLIMMMQLKDVPKLKGAAPGPSILSKVLTLVPNVGVAAMLMWYIIICHKNREYIEADTMPDQWNTYAWFISLTLLVHMILLVAGRPDNMVGCVGWITMSVIAIFVSMQRVVADNFRTDGFQTRF